MALKVKDIINIMEDIAPVKYKESYDNVGFMVGDREQEVTKLLIALDCTLDVINEGKDLGVEMILTHHPLIFKKPSSITTDTLQGMKIIELIRNNINLYSAHTNWDTIANGLNDTIVKLLGFKQWDIIDKNPMDGNSGIGRIVELEEIKTLKELIDLLKEKLQVANIKYSGQLHKEIKKIAIINGSGQDYFQRAVDMGADLVITGDTTYHFVSDYTEMGLSIIDIGHFNSEWPVVKYLGNQLKEQLEQKGVEVILSSKAKNPYKFI